MAGRMQRDHCHGLMKAAEGVRRLADGLLSVVWAPPCAACDALLEQPTRGAVCPACWRRIELIAPPLCNACGLPLPAAGGDVRAGADCASCLVRPPAAGHLARQRAAGWYRGALRSIIRAFKFQGRRSLAEPLAALMRDAGGPLLGAADLVVPVPLHPRRRWARGFNQARDLALRLGPPVADVLRRTRHTRPQTALAAGRRRANVAGAFELSWRGPCRTRHPVAGRTVVVADDVLTTGATLDACARALRAAGARAVFAITAARVAPRRPRRAPPPPRARATRRRPAPTPAAPPAGDSSP